MRDRPCSTCRFFHRTSDGAGDCRRTTVLVAVYDDYWCGKHKFSPPSREVLDTEFTMLNFSVRSRNILKNMGLGTVEDLILVGRQGLRPHGTLDMCLLREVSAKLGKLGVDW